MDTRKLGITRWVKARALELGFDDVAIADATQSTPYAAQFLAAIAQERHGPLDYLTKTAIQRSDIQQLLPGAQSVVILVKNYYVGDHAEFAPAADLSRSVKVSRYAWGRDYHHWFKKRLRVMRREFLAQAGEKSQVHIFNDTGPVLERAWAEHAGLGFIGKSGMFIHRKLGTWTFLGGFVTDFGLAADKPYPGDHCGSCTRCLDACPTQAIVAPRVVDARRCLTTWNVERPLLSQADDPQLGGHGWGVGCDICQEVCPWNKFEKKTDESRFFPLPDHVLLSEASLVGDLNGTNFARPGVEGLKRSLHRQRPR